MGSLERLRRAVGDEVEDDAEVGVARSCRSGWLHRPLHWVRSKCALGCGRVQEQNERCNEQLEELRRRLAQLSEQLAASAGPPEDDEAPPAYTAAVLHPTSCPGVRLERKRFRDVAALSSCSSMASPEEDSSAHKG
ncbi:hypothetical protein V5799_004126 [Amblyomma americanum]|uniref:Uncharacterized protein n=1 Tax=Amblyomma americanum TaxID=6943 RepID=A0AAQ4D704_AMBAM